MVYPQLISAVRPGTVPSRWWNRVPPGSCHGPGRRQTGRRWLQLSRTGAVGEGSPGHRALVPGNKPTEEVDPGPHHPPLELESESIRSEADDAEDRAQMPPLWGWGVLCHCFSVSDQLSPTMSLGSVYILQSVGSLTAERTTPTGGGRGGGRSRPRACHFSDTI